MRNILGAVILLVSFSVFAESKSHRVAAQEVIEAFEVKTLNERAIDMTKAIINMGVKVPYSENELITKFEKLLSSKAFMNDVQNIYMSNFTEEELTQIAKLLKDPALNKFIASRFKIMTDSQKVLGSHMQGIFQ